MKLPEPIYCGESGCEGHYVDAGRTQCTERKGTMIQPLNDRVLIRLKDYKQESAIIVPDAYREDSRIGEVLAVGPGRWRDDCFCRTSLRPGQMVLISPAVNLNYDDIIKREGEVMVQEDDVMGVLVEV